MDITEALAKVKKLYPWRVIGQCSHCGERYAGSENGACRKYCKDCTTAAGRKAIDDENAKIKAERV
jgi:hypothetical protein